MSDLKNANKIKFMPLPYIGMYDLDVIYQTSDAELLYQILFKVNEIAQSQNILIDNFNALLDWANEQIETYTRQQLQDWLDNGDLEEIILSFYARFNNFNLNVPSLFIGDSYTVGSGSSDKRTPWVKYYAENVGLNDNFIHNLAVGGTGLNQGDPNFLQQLQRYDGNRDEILYIYLIAGYNDGNGMSESSLISAMKSINSYVSSSYKNAKLIVGMVGNNSIISTDGRLWRLRLNQRVLKAYKTLNFKSQYVYGIENVLKNYKYLSNDNYHPNDAGHKAIGDYVSNFMQGGNICANDFRPLTLTNNNFNITTDLYEHKTDHGYIIYSHNDTVLTATSPQLQNTKIYIDIDCQFYRPVENFSFYSKYEITNGTETYSGIAQLYLNHSATGVLLIVDLSKRRDTDGAIMNKEYTKLTLKNISLFLPSILE